MMFKWLCGGSLYETMSLFQNGHWNKYNNNNNSNFLNFFLVHNIKIYCKCLSILFFSPSTDVSVSSCLGRSSGVCCRGTFKPWRRRSVCPYHNSQPNTKMHQSLQIQSFCMQLYIWVTNSWSLWLIINWNICRAGSCPAFMRLGKSSGIIFYYWYRLCREKAAAIYFFMPYLVLQSCAFTGCVFHSEDLEDTDHCAGHSWC